MFLKKKFQIYFILKTKSIKRCIFEKSVLSRSKVVPYRVCTHFLRIWSSVAYSVCHLIGTTLAPWRSNKVLWCICPSCAMFLWQYTPPPGFWILSKQMGTVLVHTQKHITFHPFLIIVKLLWSQKKTLFPMCLHGWACHWLFYTV